MWLVVWFVEVSLNPSAMIPAVTTATAIHSQTFSLWSRKKTEKKARMTNPEPWMERAMEMGV